MTESFEDLQRIRRSLLDAAAADYRQTLAAVPADVPPSRAYRRWRRRLLRNPQGLLRQQARPPWARALRGVACAVLALSLTFGAVMMVSPEARAAVSRWFFREEDTYTAYQFHGDISQDSMRAGFLRTCRRVIPYSTGRTSVPGWRWSMLTNTPGKPFSSVTSAYPLGAGGP